jgi:hypothetical protein
MKWLSGGLFLLNVGYILFFLVAGSLPWTVMATLGALSSGYWYVDVVRRST